MNRILLIVAACSMLMGCAGGHYHHNTLSQSQVDQIDFDCRYKAEMMSQQYKNVFVSSLDWAENFDRCMRAHGFQFVKNK